MRTGSSNAWYMQWISIFSALLQPLILLAIKSMHELGKVTSTIAIKTRRSNSKTLTLLHQSNTKPIPFNKTQNHKTFNLTQQATTHTHFRSHHFYNEIIPKTTINQGKIQTLRKPMPQIRHDNQNTNYKPIKPRKRWHFYGKNSSKW